MTTPMLTIDHPTDETLAAFVDDRLDETARRATTEHLADCGECRETVLMAADYQAENASNVTRGTFGKRGMATLAAALAVAAGLAVVFGPSLLQPDIDDVIGATSALTERPGLGRVDEMPYRQDRNTRSADSAAGEDVTPENAALHILNAETKDPHAQGVITLLVAKEAPELDKAVALLETAHRAKPRNDRIKTDLAAAYIARGDWHARRQDYQKALELTNDVLSRHKTPAALWNRAAALERMESQDAISAWDAYLELDSTSRWGVEARERAEDLKSLSPIPPAPPPS